jgi:hypothetical protein
VTDSERPLAALRLPAGAAASVASVAAFLAALDVTPGTWSNGAGDRYAGHVHGTTKLLMCAAGSITFLLTDGDRIDLHPGEGFVLPPGTWHSAIVGPDGVTCVEGHRA